MTAIDTAPFLGLPYATITLASASVTRQNILHAAGVDFNAAPTAIDEIGVRADAQAGDMAADEIAVLLAFLKAQAASQILLPAQSPTHSSYIIGCDQILLIDDHIMPKPESLTDAKQQLLMLAGKQHELLSAIVLIRDGQRIWHHLGRAALTMRKFDDAFVNAYIRRVGEAALWSPGAYQIESVGLSLFARIDGDHFDILGLPLLPLLGILHEHGLRPLETV
jgi:septum formation protein